MRSDLFFSVLSGLIFGLGLILGGMTDPAKVKAFLDVAGLWDPSLAVVMAGAVAMGVAAFARARRQPLTWSGVQMEVPALTVIDTRLVLGGVLFGTGWGLAGFCPGPAWVAAAAGWWPAMVFVFAMLAGMVLHDRVLMPR